MANYFDQFDEPAAAPATADTAPAKNYFDRFDGTKATDVAKSIGAGALDAVGTIAQGASNLGAQGINRGLEAVTGYNPKLRGGNPLESTAKALRDSRSEGGKFAQEQSTPSGSIDDFDSISLGADPSIGGYAQNIGDVIGQFVAPVAVAALTRGRVSPVTAEVIGGVQGGLQAGGAAAGEEGQRVRSQTPEQLAQVSSVYRDYIAKGFDPAEAQERTALDAELGAGTIGAIPAVAEGALLQGILGGRLKVPAVGNNAITKAATGALGAGIGEGLQEVSEGVAQRIGGNVGAGTDNDLLEDSVANAVLGFAGGAVAGGGIKALEGSQSKPAADKNVVDPVDAEIAAGAAQREQDAAVVAAAAAQPDAGPLTRTVAANAEATTLNPGSKVSLKKAFEDLQVRQAFDENRQKREEKRLKEINKGLDSIPRAEPGADGGPVFPSTGPDEILQPLTGRPFEGLPAAASYRKGMEDGYDYDIAPVGRGQFVLRKKSTEAKPNEQLELQGSTQPAEVSAGRPESGRSDVARGETDGGSPGAAAPAGRDARAAGGIGTSVPAPTAVGAAQPKQPSSLTNAQSTQEAAPVVPAAAAKEQPAPTGPQPAPVADPAPQEAAAPGLAAGVAAAGDNPAQSGDSTPTIGDATPQIGGAPQDQEDTPAAQWTRMPTAERSAVLKRAGLSDKLLNKPFAQIGAPGQSKIKKAMAAKPPDAAPEVAAAQTPSIQDSQIPNTAESAAAPAAAAATTQAGQASTTPAVDAAPTAAPAAEQAEFVPFAKESGTLGIPRAEMPQVKAEHRGAMVNFLNARGVEHEQDEVDPATLKATQAEFSPAKVEKAKTFEGGNRSILVSADGYIVDGHHQALASLEKGEKIKVIRLKAPVRELLPLVTEFPSSTQANGATSAQPAPTPEIQGQQATRAAPPTETAQAAAEESAPAAAKTEPAQLQQSRSRGNKPARTTAELLARIRRSILSEIDGIGGLEMGERANIIGEKRSGGPRGGLSLKMFRRNGAAIDRLGERFRELGYLSDAEGNDVTGGAEAIRELVRAAYYGEAVVPIPFAEEYGELQNREREEAQAAADSRAAAALLAEYGDYAQEDFESAAEGRDQLDENSAEDAELVNALQRAQEYLSDAVISALNEKHESAQRLIEALNEAINNASSVTREIQASDGRSEADGADPQSPGERLGASGSAGAAAAPRTAEDFALEQQTESDLASKAAREESAPAADQRAQVDREAAATRGESFLQRPRGQVTPAPQQTGLFNGSGKPATQRPAANKQPTDKEPAEKASIEDVGEKIGGARKDTATSTGQRSRRNDDEQRPAWARRFEVSQIATPGGQINPLPDDGRWMIRDKRNLDWTGQPKQVGRTTFATKAEADAFVPIAAVGMKHRPVPTRDGKFEIWRDVTDRKRVKVLDKEFDSREDAMRYMAANAVAIIETNTTFGEADIPLPPDRERTGPERRTGNVKGDDFKTAFGFRGVEFGNWNNQDERQSLMNDAWDGLMDLADIMGVPPKALGLNGDLALAFGARGHGLNSARAHYELDRAVINLTKERGAGSLAHEWFHALDHYFGRQDGKASAAWITQADGTRTLKVDGAGADMASAGFSGKSSRVRPELREAYESLLQTMFKKAEGYVEDTQRADQFTARARDDLAEQLDRLRADLATQQDPRYYKRNNKPASAEQLAEFDSIAKSMLDGEATALATEWRMTPGSRAAIAARWTNDTLERMSAIYKAVRGRSGFDTTNGNGLFDRLRGGMERYSQRLKMLADAQSGTEKKKMVPTDFAMNAKELDQGRGTDYWTTPHEMAARAFQGYIEDKVAERGDVSRFLNYGPERAMIPTPWGFKRPFPTGEERKAINKAFDRFVETVETREDEDGNVAMFSLKDRLIAPIRADGLPIDQVQATVNGIVRTWKNAPRVVVVRSMADPAAPAAARAAYARQQAGGAKGVPMGFITRDGTVYIVAGAQSSPKTVARTLFHEALGHAGLRATYGAELGAILDQLANVRGADMQRKAKQYGLDLKKPGDRQRVAEEVLAELAETRPEIGFVRRAIAAIRKFLRERGVNLAVTDDEIIRDYILPARRFIEKGPGGNRKSVTSGANIGDARPAFSLKGRIGSDRSPSAGFPPVHHMNVLGATKNHPDYAAAKSGDLDAANRLVRDLIQTDKLESLRSALAGRKPVIVPVQAVERSGRNKIPAAYAERLASELGLKTDPEIVQSVRAFHTNADAFQRIGSQPAFDGPVVAGQEYLIVDDTQTIGGTLANLRGHIEANGGKVLMASTLTGFPQSADIALRPAMRDSLLAKHGKALDDYLQEQFGFGIDQLTQGEAGHLRAAPSLDAIRDRIAQGRSALGLDSPQTDDRGGEDSGLAFSLATPAAADLMENLRDRVALFNDSRKTFNGWWHKTVGTQYHKAQIDADYKKVFDRSQQYLTDVSRFALGAADEAQEILPRFEKLSDLAKSGASPRELAPVAEAIFRGTLDDEKVYNDAELVSRYSLNPKQVRLYRQARKAIERSLDDMALTEAVKLIRPEISEQMARQAASMPSLRELVATFGDVLKPETVDMLQERIEKIDSLKAKGYAPLMRFGQFSVYATGPGGEQLYYGMFEDEAEARRVEREMREQYPQATVQRGVVSEKSYQMFQGMSPDALELFASVTGMEQNEAFQAYLKVAKNNRSALKRLIKRKGIEGYNPDLKRVLAQFITSNARASSANLHFGEITRDWSAIPKEKGDVKDEAADLVGYMQNPQEEAAKVRGLLFFNFIGGSIASAAVNMTQPLTMTFPYLAQWGAGKAAGEMAKAMKIGAGSVPQDADTRQAMDRAHREGIVEPHQIFELQGAAMRSEGNWGKADRLRETWSKGMFLWGRLFSLAESFNRRSTFAAAYRIGKGLDATQLQAAGVSNAYDFAVKAVNETQGIYNRGNRPDWARGAVGATLFTFKQYSISYMEFLKRLPKRERVLALGVLVLSAGLNGLPGADDLDDLIDTIAQGLGFNFNTRVERNRLIEIAVAPLFGSAGVDFVQNGVSAALPIDVQQRMGLANLIPGTGIALKSNPDPLRDAEEAIGPFAGLVSNVASGVGRATSALASGDFKGAAFGFAEEAAPVAAQNLIKGIRMHQMGFYQDTKGRRVLDTDTSDALAKAIGFQPRTVAVESRKVQDARQDIQLNKTVEAEIADLWAQGLFEKDAEKVARARERLTTWNQRNPESRIAIAPGQIARRVKEMRMTRAQRFIKTAPKEIRAGVAEGIQ